MPRWDELAITCSKSPFLTSFLVSLTQATGRGVVSGIAKMFMLFTGLTLEILSSFNPLVAQF